MAFYLTVTSKRWWMGLLSVVLCFMAGSLPAAEKGEDLTELENLAPGLSAAFQEEENPSVNLSLTGNAAADHHTSIYYTMQANRERLNPKKFHGKLGFNFQIAPSIKNMMDYTAIDFSYGFPLTWGWIELMIAKQTTTFARVGHHDLHPAILNPDLKTKNDAIMLGIGASMTSDYPQILLPKLGNKIYATATTYLTYLSYKDNDWNANFNGFGLKVEAGFHYRLMNLLHVGAKVFYYLNVMHSTKNTADTIPEKITLSWPAIGLDVGYYF